MQFLPEREDFWPKDYLDEKIGFVSYHEIMSILPVSNVLSLIQIVESVKSKKKNQ